MRVNLLSSASAASADPEDSVMRPQDQLVGLVKMGLQQAKLDSRWE